jgi:hypothetical protein
MCVGLLQSGNSCYDSKDHYDNIVLLNLII